MQSSSENKGRPVLFFTALTGFVVLVYVAAVKQILPEVIVCSSVGWTGLQLMKKRRGNDPTAAQ